jgi:hypothetical protein
MILMDTVPMNQKYSRRLVHKVLIDAGHVNAVPMILKVGKSDTLGSQYSRTFSIHMVLMDPGHVNAPPMILKRTNSEDCVTNILEHSQFTWF